jgi:hypothetical protein
LGFQVSPQLTWMSSSNGDITNNNVKAGLKYGLEADIFIEGLPRYSLNTGFFVSTHSFNAHYDVDESFFINEVTFDQPVDLRFKLSYIEIPLNIKLRSDQFHRSTFFGQFGFTNLINIGATATSSDSQLTGDNINEGISDRTIHIFNLCMLMGGGVEYDIGGNTTLNLGIQYSNGLIDVTSISNLDEKTTFHSFRLVIGAMF